MRRQGFRFSHAHSRMHFSRSLQHSPSQVIRFYALVVYILSYLVCSPQQKLFIPVTLQSSQGSFTLAGFGFQVCTFTNTRSLQTLSLQHSTSPVLYFFALLQHPRMEGNVLDMKFSELFIWLPVWLQLAIQGFDSGISRFILKCRIFGPALSNQAMFLRMFIDLL